MSETVPKAPEGAHDRPVYLETGGTDPYGGLPMMHVWGAVYDHDPETGEPAREYLGTGRLLGHLRRERTDDTYQSSMYEVAPHFTIGDDYRKARAEDDVELPLVEAVPSVPTGYWNAGELLPCYPRCPDCGGRIAWAEAGGVPGSRKCEGFTEPDLYAAGSAASPPGVSSKPEGCGSRFTDTRYGVADPIEEEEACRAGRT